MIPVCQGLATTSLLETRVKSDLSAVGYGIIVLNKHLFQRGQIVIQLKQ
jgi:hypothetical protein